MTLPPATAHILSYAIPTFAATTAALAAATFASISPRNQLWGKVLSHASTASTAHYALTFDDGPTPGATDRILDILADLRTPATFFVIGINVRRAPGLLRRIHDDGHLIGNHTYHHSHFSMLRGPRYWHDEITRTNDLIENLIGLRPAIFRPPMGVKTPFNHRAAGRAGQPVITWNRRAYDGIAATTPQILQRLVPITEPGDILMLHDGIEPYSTRDPAPSVNSVRPLIEQLHQRGLSAGRLDQLLAIPPYARSL